MAKPSYEDLWDENVVLKERLAALLNDQPAMVLKDRLRLPGMQSPRVLALLLDRQRVAKDAIYGMIFEQANGDGPELKIVDVVVSKTRKALSEAGAPDGITTIWGVGYGITDELRDYCLALLQPRAIAA